MKKPLKYLFQLSLGYPANAIGAKVGVTRLDTAETAKIFKPLLLPFCD